MASLEVTVVDWEGDSANANSEQLSFDTRHAVEAKIKGFIQAKTLPGDADALLRGFALTLCQQGDLLLYPSVKGGYKKMSEKIFDDFVTSVAILSFYPCGVVMFGYRYKASL